MQNIQSYIREVIKSLYDIDFSPEITPAPKKELGEYCVNIFPIVKTLGKSPNILSEEIANELAKNTLVFKSTSATGGYVNFFLTDTVWLGLFADIQKSGESEGGKLSESDDKGKVKGEANEFFPPLGAFDTFQSGKVGYQKTIIVDYIGANVGKPLHIGHICTPSVGQTICNIYHHLGYRVIGDSHFGDWGGIFGKLIEAWKQRLWLESGEEKQSGKELLFIKLEKEGISFLLELYQWFFEEVQKPLVEDGTFKNKDFEEGARKEFQYLSGVGIDLSNPEEKKHHEENVALWKKFTSISITETEKKLKLLNVEATYNIGESFYEGLGLPRPNNESYPDLQYTMKDVVKELIEKGVATQNDDGSVGVVFPEEMKLPSCILQKKDGTGLYLTSDLAAIKYRLTNGWNPKKIIYSVDVRQQLHLRQAFAIAKMAWPDLTEGVEFFHAFNGFIKLKEGAMSTRHGTVIFLEKLIEEGNERTKNILEEKGRTGEKALTSDDIEAITVGAIKYSYLTQDREKDVVFDWDKALSFEGHSGPYIQYAYVRAKKIGSNIEKESLTPERASYQNDKNFELSSYDKSLIQILRRFDDVVDTTAKTYKPHHLALYAYDLAVEFNSFYVHTPKILEEEDKNRKIFRLNIVQKTAITLEKSFELLGIKMPTEM